ncbi:MAG: hypothetical protein ACR2QF_10280 [Geminicoccaceae bacterium]
MTKIGAGPAVNRAAIDRSAKGTGMRDHHYLDVRGPVSADDDLAFDLDRRAFKVACDAGHIAIDRDDDTAVISHRHTRHQNFGVGDVERFANALDDELNFGQDDDNDVKLTMRSPADTVFECRCGLDSKNGCGGMKDPASCEVTPSEVVIDTGAIDSKLLLSRHICSIALWILDIAMAFGSILARQAGTSFDEQTMRTDSTNVDPGVLANWASGITVICAYNGKTIFNAVEP